MFFRWLKIFPQLPSLAILLLFGMLPSCHRKTLAPAPVKPDEKPTLTVEKNKGETPHSKQSRIITGAERTEAYFPQLAGKRLGLVVNPSSRIGGLSLVDSLIRAGFQVKKIFGPEHGFRGNAGPGIKINSELDPATGIPIVSLYGKKMKPTPDQLQDLDLLLFDIQDVGARFYTYNQTLHYVMEACAENGKPILVLDRPNPLPRCVDGPILEPALKSFIGMHPIPICHGMTVGEFALMLNGEKWLKDSGQCYLKVIQMENYTHDSLYALPVAPSPNLNTTLSVSLYASLCLFEGTRISLGRGTLIPFTVLGSPDLKGQSDFEFTPQALPGMAENPLYKGQTCYGFDLRQQDWKSLAMSDTLHLRWLPMMLSRYPHRELFFDKSISNQIGDFDKLAGTRELRKQLEAGVSLADIRKSWASGLARFKAIRHRYLLY